MSIVWFDSSVIAQYGLWEDTGIYTGLLNTPHNIPYYNTVQFTTTNSVNMYKYKSMAVDIGGEAIIMYNVVEGNTSQITDTSSVFGS